VDLPQKISAIQASGFGSIGINFVIEVSDGLETVLVDANIFEAFSPLVYLEENNMINTQWTIFRMLN